MPPLSFSPTMPALFSSQKTPWLFFMDLVRSASVTLALAPPAVWLLVAIIEAGGPYLALYLWAALLALALVFMVLYPTVIAPLFNKFEPLPAGPLREAIEALASSLKFPLAKLYVVNGSTRCELGIAAARTAETSKAAPPCLRARHFSEAAARTTCVSSVIFFSSFRSAHSNAYMYGFFHSKRIVLYDTLIDGCPDDKQIVAVLAHELGHWKKGHTLKLLASHQARGRQPLAPTRAAASRGPSWLPPLTTTPANSFFLRL